MPRSTTAVVVAIALFIVSGAAAAAAEKLTVKVLATASSGRLAVDKPPKGEISAGDVLVGADRLRNAVAQFGKPKGAVVGRDAYRIAFRSATRGTITVSATLPGGTVSCKGAFDSAKRRNVLGVTGATGRFAGATGTCEALQAAGGQTLNVYRLTVP